MKNYTPEGALMEEPVDEEAGAPGLGEAVFILQVVVDVGVDRFGNVCREPWNLNSKFVASSVPGLAPGIPEPKTLHDALMRAQSALFEKALENVVPTKVEAVLGIVDGTGRVVR